MFFSAKVLGKIGKLTHVNQVDEIWICQVLQIYCYKNQIYKFTTFY